ncbi:MULTISPECIES: MlaC/ttg2D family ABC transporter substrate-binding protein [unclassified Campylobacter]|uniref:MlaC/ttg2D family ABC transporter substrate-binding protein n=1 Tax=unclassified Campylobacter TaxID=2593542 RepID=UPI0014736DE6|nr:MULTISPECIES: ABC transporter substrate-binding protein [unclassified Campylobacter]QKG30074.1 lipid asymmetry ABC transporter MlaABCDEF, periplasmic component MlaC [Campylobacter sp. RM16187]
MKFLKIICAMFLSVSLFAISESEIKPSVESATQNAIKVLKDKNLNKDEKADKIFAIFDPFFDYKQMAKISLSKRYDALSDVQKEQFDKAFETRLKNSYVDKLLSYNDQQINLKEFTKPNEKRYWLNGEVVSEGKSYPFVYKFYDAKDRGWLIYDLDILGVSIVQTYRSQFGSLLEKGSFEELLKRLETVNLPEDSK